MLRFDSYRPQERRHAVGRSKLAGVFNMSYYQATVLEEETRA